MTFDLFHAEGACIILLAVICAGTLAQAHPLWRAVKNIVSFWEMCQKSVVECRTAFTCHLYEQIHLQIFVKKMMTKSFLSLFKLASSINHSCTYIRVYIIYFTALQFTTSLQGGEASVRQMTQNCWLVLERTTGVSAVSAVKTFYYSYQCHTSFSFWTVTNCLTADAI